MAFAAHARPLPTRHQSPLYPRGGKGQGEEGAAIATGFVGALCALVASPTWAATATVPDSPVSIWNLFQVLGGLALVLGVVVFAAHLMKRLQPAGWGRSGPIRVVASMAVGTRERVVLVEAGEQQLLLGVTANQVNLLHVFAEPLALETATPIGTPNFAAWLQKTIAHRRT